MATKRFKEQTNFYDIVVENKKYTVRVYEYTTYCYSSYNNVEHSCVEIYDETYKTVANVMGRDSWSNRPWYTFRYENSRYNACKKLPKFLQEHCKNVLVEQEAKKEEERCNSFLKSFKKGWDSLNDESRESVASAVGFIDTKEQADAALGLVTLASLILE